MLEKKLEILYDHYKDSFENQKSFLKKRNNYTFICIGIVAVLSFQLSDPVQSVFISNELIKKNIGNVTIDINYINNILTFAFMWIVMMYYQINFLIEKIYKYIQNIEVILSKELTPFEITREGKTYFDNHPWLSKVIQKIYTIIFPITLISVAIMRLPFKGLRRYLSVFYIKINPRICTCLA